MVKVNRKIVETSNVPDFQSLKSFTYESLSPPVG